jgi:hypothetical protein
MSIVQLFHMVDNGGKWVDPEYRVLRKSLVEKHDDPQVFEAECVDGVLLYIRFKDGALRCQEWRTGAFICEGHPFLERNKNRIDPDKIEFYLEMYSKHKIRFE